MKVKELIKELKKHDQDAEVFMVADWDKVEDGKLVDIYPLRDIVEQVDVIEDGMDWIDQRQVLLDFDEECYFKNTWDL